MMRRAALILCLASSVALAQSTPMTPLRIAVVQKATAPSVTPGDCVNGVSPSVLALNEGVVYECVNDGGSDYYSPVSLALKDPTSGFVGSFDVSGITANHTYSWLDAPGTVALVEYIDPDDDGLDSLTNTDPVLQFSPLSGNSGGGMLWRGCASGCSSAQFQMTQATSGLVTAYASGGATSGRWLFTGTGSPTLEVTGTVKATNFRGLAITDTSAATLTFSSNKTLSVTDTATINGGTHSGTNTGDQTSVSGNAGTATALAADGANCSAGSAAGGVSASGAAEDCTAYQPLDADLTSFAALTTTAHGLGLLDDADGAASRATVGAWYALPVLSIQGAGASLSPSDGQTYYFGNIGKSPSTTANLARIYIRRAGIIRVAEIAWNAGAVVGTGENVSLYVRLNDTTDTLIATVGDTNQFKSFSNAAINITVASGDYVEIKMVCPTWATNPTGVGFGGYLLVE